MSVSGASLTAARKVGANSHSGEKSKPIVTVEKRNATNVNMSLSQEKPKNMTQRVVGRYHIVLQSHMQPVE